MSSEPEHHSHRTDQEWRAIIRGWKEKLEKSDIVYGNGVNVLGIIQEMERIVDEH